MTVYSGSNPRGQDTLWTGRYAETALALLAQDLLGTGTQIFGAPCGATTPASMSVFIGAGRIYSMAALEPTAWSSLPADATLVLKQGILNSLGATLACPAPVTGGFSTNYLIEGQFQENDLLPQTLSYWNASNPQQPWSGASNNGLAQPTVRSGQFIVQAKAGVPASTGAQTTPTVDAGWVPMYVVTVANGATTITSANIVSASGAPFSAGSFIATLTGVSGVTMNVNWSIANGQAILTNNSGTPFGASSSTALTLTGLPANLQPATAIQFVPMAAFDNSTIVHAAGVVAPGSGTITFQRGVVVGSALTYAASGWTASGGKGFDDTFLMAYSLK